MKTKIVQTVVFVILALASGFTNKPGHITADSWNGTVSFTQMETGPFIIISESRIEGNFKNSAGPVLHTSNYKSKWDKYETVNNCTGTSEGRVEVNIDEISKTYRIYVSGVADCSGISIENGVSEEYLIPGGDTVIYIDRQPLGTNPNLLAGTVTIKEGPYSKGKMQSMTYKWNLTRSP